MNKKLAAILAALDEHDTTRTVCPYCNGGTSGEASFNATREGDTYYWKCFRASCGRAGKKGNVIHVTSPIRNRNTKVWEGDCEPLSDDWRAFLNAKVGFDSWHCSTAGCLYAPREHRVAYPIFDPMGQRRGWLLRAYDDRDFKALTYPERVDEPHLSYYRTHVGSPHVIVVEDIPSAVRASRYTNAVALLGTGVRLDDALEIAAHFRSVTWALDADATKLALKWHMKYGGFFESSELLVLQKDLKDMTEDELVEALRRD